MAKKHIGNLKSNHNTAGRNTPHHILIIFRAKTGVFFIKMRIYVCLFLSVYYSDEK